MLSLSHLFVCLPLSLSRSKRALFSFRFPVTLPLFCSLLLYSLHSFFSNSRISAASHNPMFLFLFLFLSACLLHLTLFPLYFSLSMSLLSHSLSSLFFLFLSQILPPSLFLAELTRIYQEPPVPLFPVGFAFKFEEKKLAISHNRPQSVQLFSLYIVHTYHINLKSTSFRLL